MTPDSSSGATSGSNSESTSRKREPLCPRMYPTSGLARRWLIAHEVPTARRDTEMGLEHRRRLNGNVATRSPFLSPPPERVGRPTSAPPAGRKSTDGPHPPPPSSRDNVGPLRRKSTGFSSERNTLLSNPAPPQALLSPDQRVGHTPRLLQLERRRHRTPAAPSAPLSRPNQEPSQTQIPPTRKGPQRARLTAQGRRGAAKRARPVHRLPARLQLRIDVRPYAGRLLCAYCVRLYIPVRRILRRYLVHALSTRVQAARPGSGPPLAGSGCLEVA